MTDHPVDHAELAALAERFLHGAVSAAELSTLVEAVPALLDKVEELTAQKIDLNKRWADYHHAELVKRRDAERRVADLEAVARRAIGAIGAGGHTHWREGGAGGRCSACDRATGLRNEIGAELDRLLSQSGKGQTEGQEGD